MADQFAVGDIGGVVDLIQQAAQAALLLRLHVLGHEVVAGTAAGLGQHGRHDGLGRNSDPQPDPVLVNRSFARPVARPAERPWAPASAARASGGPDRAGSASADSPWSSRGGPRGTSRRWWR